MSADMAREAIPAAVLLDALGTLVELERPWLQPLVDAVVISAEVGVAKPDPAIFRAALERLGARAEDSLHVGDSVENDVAGARAAGLDAVLVARNGAAAPDGVRAVRSLAELVA